MANLYLIACDSYTNATPITTIVGGELVSAIKDYRTYTNNLGQTVALIETSEGMLPAIIVTPANTADSPTQPYVTAAPTALKDQDEVGIHPLSPQYPGQDKAVVSGAETDSALATEIAAIED